jgi:hypothetical protein
MMHFLNDNNQYRADIKQAAATDTYFDQVNADNIADYYGIHSNIVLIDIAKERQTTITKGE